MTNNNLKLQKLSIIFLILIIINCFVLEIDGKRSFSVRIRSKNSGRSNSRRKSTDAVHVPSPGGKDAVAAGPSIGKSVAKPVDAAKLNGNKPSAPEGPPPAYPGLGNNPVAPHGSPPAYSGGGLGNLPSYEASQHAYRNQRESIPSRTHGYGSSYPYNSGSNIQSIPPRGQYPSNSGISGINGATTFQGLGTGHNAFGGPSQSGPHYNNYASNNGGLYNGMGNYNGNTNMMNGGMGGGSYGSGYGYGQSSGNGLSFGNILTGVALWNVARGFNHYPSPSHQQHMHVHNHYDNNNNKTDAVVLPKDVTVPLNATPSPVSTITTTTTTMTPLQYTGSEHQQNLRRTSTTSTQLTQP